jgi:hypothetical protein
MTHTEAVQTFAAERYLLDEMSEPERFSFEDHYFSCLECAEDVRAGAAMRDAVKRGELGAGSVVSMPEAKRRRPAPVPVGSLLTRTALPWAAAAVLALAVGYQSLSDRQGRTQPLEPQALNPVTLRAETRGAAPIVPLPADAALVTLALDVRAAENSQLTYDLRTSTSDAVASGQVATPSAGAPLLLLLPVWTLNPSEHYILSVRGAADGQLIGEYRFDVAAR